MELFTCLSSAHTSIRSFSLLLQRDEKNIKFGGLFNEMPIVISSKWGCLDLEQSLPPENPIWCRKNESNLVFRCCKTVDYCNEDLDMSSSQGKESGMVTHFCRTR